MEVSPATATDAAGEAVPTNLTVSGDQLRITVEPEIGAVYPILVDPNFRMEEYSWTWGGSKYKGWTPVKSASGYFASEWAASTPALDLYSGWGGGSAVPNTGAQWVYSVPRYNHYDEGEPTPPAGTPYAFLPTKETVGVVAPGKEGEFEAKTTETRYDWTLRRPTETIIDPGGLGIQSITVYNSAGQVTETRQPKNSGGGGAGTTVTQYYKVQSNGEMRKQTVREPALQGVSGGTGRRLRPAQIAREAFHCLQQPRRAGSGHGKCRG